MLNHLFHRTILQELAVLVAVHAVIFILTSVGVGAEHLICERHSAALTKFLFHTIIFIRFDAAKVYIFDEITKYLG
jgi:hypothetical protein